MRKAGLAFPALKHDPSRRASTSRPGHVGRTLTSDQAMEAQHRATAAGFKGIDWIKKDTAFESLQSPKDFNRLLSDSERGKFA